jgi:hypothetical protein
LIHPQTALPLYHRLIIVYSWIRFCDKEVSTEQYLLGSGYSSLMTMAHRFLFYWLPLIMWILGIFLVSTLSTTSFPAESGVPIEYPLHITASFVLFLLLYRLFRSNHKNAALGGILLSSLVFTMIVSLSKECWQLLIPTRSFSMKDIIVDGGAATLAMMAASIGARGLFRH